MMNTSDSGWYVSVCVPSHMAKRVQIYV